MNSRRNYFANARFVGVCLALCVCCMSSAVFGGTTKVLCLGDSITAGAYVASTEAYPHVLQDKLGSSYAVTNAGQNGLRADGLLSKLNSGSYISADPDIVTIMIGTNDLNNASDKAAAVTETFNEIQSCVNRVRTYSYADGKTPKIYVSAVIPTKSNASLNVYIASLNTMLASSLTGETLFFTDNWTDLYNSATGLATSSLMYDTLHPNASGQAVLADNFYNVITTGVPEPCSMAMLAVGGLALLRRRRQR